jgi:hypothetical protein
MSVFLQQALEAADACIVDAELRFTSHLERAGTFRRHGAAQELTRILQDSLSARWLRRQQLFRADEALENVARSLGQPTGTLQ